MCVCSTALMLGIDIKQEELEKTEKQLKSRIGKKKKQSQQKSPRTSQSQSATPPTQANEKNYAIVKTCKIDTRAGTKKQKLKGIKRRYWKRNPASEIGNKKMPRTQNQTKANGIKAQLSRKKDVGTLDRGSRIQSRIDRDNLRKSIPYFYFPDPKLCLTQQRLPLPMANKKTKTKLDFLLFADRKGGC